MDTLKILLGATIALLLGALAVSYKNNAAPGESSAEKNELAEMKRQLAEIQAELARVRDSKVAAQQVLEIGSIGGEFSELLRAMRAQLPETARLQRRIDHSAI